MNNLESFVKRYGFCGHDQKSDDYVYCNLSSKQCKYQSESQFPYVYKGQVGGRMYLCRKQK
ncbi:MAG: hypothetical protein D4S01_08870 [Dehalococcoidia bacterium]|nr:MAG: hypothetical protein D4S01_08870 [Dehalococcoidia bacterium]